MKHLESRCQTSDLKISTMKKAVEKDKDLHTFHDSLETNTFLAANTLNQPLNQVTYQMYYDLLVIKAEKLDTGDATT